MFAKYQACRITAAAAAAEQTAWENMSNVLEIK